MQGWTLGLLGIVTLELWQAAMLQDLGEAKMLA